MCWSKGGEARAARGAQSLGTKQEKEKQRIGQLIPHHTTPPTPPPDNLQPPQVRYSAAHGFMLALSDVAEQYNLTVADSALSSSAVHVGGITLRNAPRFDPVTGRGVTVGPNCGMG